MHSRRQQITTKWLLAFLASRSENLAAQRRLLPARALQPSAQLRRHNVRVGLIPTHKCPALLCVLFLVISRGALCVLVPTSLNEAARVLKVTVDALDRRLDSRFLFVAHLMLVL